MDVTAGPRSLHCFRFIIVVNTFQAYCMVKFKEKVDFHFVNLANEYIKLSRCIRNTIMSYLNSGRSWK